MSRERELELDRELSGCDIIVALTGQPNVGKSTLFNRLTGELARVGNFPGTTVEIKLGRTRHRDREICIVDLPGTYGLSALSIEEKIARDFLLSGKPHVVVVLVDATLPERTMYLAIQVLEMITNVIIALTKWDLAHKSGVHIHLDKLESMLGVPVVPVSGITGEGLQHLLDTIIAVAEHCRSVRSTPLRIDYDFLEVYLRELEAKLAELKIFDRVNLRWIAVRLLEGDPELESALEALGYRDLIEYLKAIKLEISRLRRRRAEDLIVEARFRYAEEIIRSSIVRVEIRGYGRRLLDQLFMHPILGAVSTVAILFSILFIAFAINTGFPLTSVLNALGLSEVAEAVEAYSIESLIDKVFNVIAEAIHRTLDTVNPILASFLADGIVAGVGAVIVFLPLILIVMLFISALEDSGLGPRMAIALHSLFSRFGLSGRAVYPLFIALGCNVPAVLASRAAIDEIERLEIAITVSFIPCQARLIVLLALTSAILPKAPHVQAIAVLMVYLGGVLLYMISSKILRRYLFHVREPPELALEVPAIHRPNIRVVWWNAWDATKHFIKKAGMIIFTLSIIVWLLLSLGPKGFVTNVTESFGSYIGKALAPLISTLFGIDPETSWKLGFALVSGFIAKEGLISTLAVLSGLEEEASLSQVLNLSIAQGFAILTFVMYYVPCLATIAVVYQETKSLKLTLFTIAYLFALALMLSIIVYGILSLLS